MIDSKKRTLISQSTNESSKSFHRKQRLTLEDISIKHMEQRWSTTHFNHEYLVAGYIRNIARSLPSYLIISVAIVKLCSMFYYFGSHLIIISGSSEGQHSKHNQIHILGLSTNRRFKIKFNELNKGLLTKKKHKNSVSKKVSLKISEKRKSSKNRKNSKNAEHTKQSRSLTPGAVNTKKHRFLIAKNTKTKMNDSLTDMMDERYIRVHECHQSADSFDSMNISENLKNAPLTLDLKKIMFCNFFFFMHKK